MASLTPRNILAVGRELAPVVPEFEIGPVVDVIIDLGIGIEAFLCGTKIVGVAVSGAHRTGIDLQIVDSLHI